MSMDGSALAACMIDKMDAIGYSAPTTNYHNDDRCSLIAPHDMARFAIWNLASTQVTKRRMFPRSCIYDGSQRSMHAPVLYS